MTKVSVIVPAYNVEKSIDRCITSLLEQTLEDIEIILINDGSTDKTDEIIQNYLPNDKIKYFKRKNFGIGSTRNFGLKKATGEYIGFVDSDDYVEKDMFEVLYKKIVSENFDMVICDFYNDYENTGKQTVEHIDFKETPNLNLHNTPSLINTVNLSPWNKLYKANMIDSNVEAFQEKCKYEDVPFVIRMLDKSKKIGKIDKPLYHYVIHNNSETTSTDERAFDILKIFNILLQEYGDKDYLKEELEYLIVQRLSDYNIQQRNQKKRTVREKFINQSFNFLKSNIKNFRKNQYYKDISLFKRIIEKNISITKIYCNLYAIIKNR